MGKLKGLLLILLISFVIVLVSGFLLNQDSSESVEVPTGKGEVDVFLLKALNSRDNTNIIVNTTYDVTWNRKYLGKWNASQDITVNITKLNKTFTFQPGDRLKLLVSVDESPYKKLIEETIPDSPTHYIIPEMYLPRLSDFKFKIWDEEKNQRLGKEGIFMGSFDSYELLIEIEKGTQRNNMFTNICCVYNPKSMEDPKLYGRYSYNHLELAFSSKLCIGREYKLLETNEDITMVVLTNDFEEEHNITCTFLDSTYFLTKSGDIGYGVEDDNWEDVGVENPSFTVKVIKQ